MIEPWIKGLTEDVANMGIYLTNGDGYTLGINHQYQKLTGIKEEEVKGRHMQELVNGGFFDQSASLLVLKYRTGIIIEQNIIRSNTKVIASGNPIFDGGGKIAMIITTVSAPPEDANEIDYGESEEKPPVGANLQGLVAASEIMQQVLARAVRAAVMDSTVLLLGESGVGKEILARLIHLQSPRRQKPFIKVNMASIPQELFESELFGYHSGAFTGALRSGKTGLVQAANGGTLFLDEIGELPPGAQAKLLRLLQEKEVLPLGSINTEEVDVRFIAATNRDLSQLVQEGKFREDLFYRLNVMPIYIPPLRERPEDICALTHQFLKHFGERYRITKHLTPAALEVLVSYHWPGNIRELENLIERLIVLYPQREITGKHVLDELFFKLPNSNDTSNNNNDTIEKTFNLTRAVGSFEQTLIEQIIRQQGNNLEKAAHILGIHRTTLLRKLRKYNLK
ncbi:AAA domain-containing protein [Desulfofundulus thermobenzoicus]|uniref:AAA domain-containing protein n=1 Tax=Desulfofundulus thermobenzoicus TaxID=29376 RepID=A0A6N7IV92_9FIRM|nr:sigma 54-interacting transcriptional regulator [Desulfofundulus thermobenzoicus]MQL53429.1 AAA domain-containing protein [Desulfofundulus thermobenzoicus]